MSQWDAEDTVVIEHVYLGSNHVGITYHYPSYCEAVPDDSESVAYLFMSPSEAAHWIRLRLASLDAAAVFADKHSLGPAK